MKIVLDINALLVCIPKKSPYRPIFDALVAGDFTLCLSNDVLSEYVEIIEQKTNALVANNIAEMLLSLGNVQPVEIYYEWKLIDKDPDDNKYVDTAISAAADYLVTNDKHFQVLTQIGFPAVTLLGIDEFLQIIKQENRSPKA